MHILKVSIKNNLENDQQAVYIEYEFDTKSGRTDECSVESSDAPLPAFTAAQVAIVEPALRIAGLWYERGNETAADGVEVRSVAYGELGATVTLAKHTALTNGPVVITVKAQHKHMSDELNKAIDVLACEAMRYVDGERAQMALRFDGDAESEAA
jgi:hypothetical protein